MKRRLGLHAINALLAAACGVRPARPPPTEAACPPNVRAAHPLPQFAHDQPWLREIRAWDGGLVAIGDNGVHRIDLGPEPRASKLRISGATWVRDVAMQRDLPIALVEVDAKNALAVRRGGAWTIEPIPEPARAAEWITLTASSRSVALLHQGWLHVREEGATTWKSRAVDVPPLRETLRGREPYRAFRAPEGSQVFFTWNQGEWGCALAAIDLRDGTWVEYELIRCPVRGMRFDSLARPWLVEDRAHLDSREGTLIRIDASSRLTALAAVAGSGSDAKIRRRWELPLASFDGLAFDERGRLHILSSDIGVARRDPPDVPFEDGCWTWLTPAWPKDQEVQDLVVHGSTLVIATFDAGIVLWDVERGTARRLTLEPTSAP
jgi:hypothetical protein